MADDTPTDSRALAPTRQNRPTIIVQSPAAIFDSGKFEHLYRVATVMAKAGLMPDSLTHVKVKGSRDNDMLQELPGDVVIARAFLIAAQADRWNMDPLGLMNCCYLAHNKLGYEGKAVHAAIQSVVGIALDYDYGAYDPKTMRVHIGVTPAQPELLGIVVFGTFPDGKTKSIEGYVGSWKHDFSGKELPAWKSPGAWPRMLRYRGAREFCNAHTPHVTLGVLTEDDFSTAESPQIQFMDATPLAEPAKLSEAFGKQAKAAATKKESTPRSPPPPPPAETKPAPIAEEPNPTSDSATDASGASPAETSGPQQAAEPSTDGAKATREADASGLQKSSAGDKSATETASPTAAEVVHALHTGQGIDTDDKGNVVSLADRKAPTTIDEIRAAQQTDNDRIIEQTRGIAPQSGDDPVDPATDPNVPELEPEPEVDVQAFNDFARDITQVGNWGAMKPILAAFRASEAFGSANPDLQGKALKLAWEPCALWPFPEGDVDFYRLWIATTAQPHEVRPAFRKLMRGAEYQNLDPETRDLVVDETNHAAGDS